MAHVDNCLHEGQISSLAVMVGLEGNEVGQEES